MIWDISATMDLKDERHGVRAMHGRWKMQEGHREVFPWTAPAARKRGQTCRGGDISGAADGRPSDDVANHP